MGLLQPEIHRNVFYIHFIVKLENTLTMHFQLLMKYLGQIYTYNKCSPRWLFWPDRNVLSPYRGGIWAPSSYKPFWSHRRRRLSQCQVPANSVSAHNEGCSLARWKHIIWELISEVACTLHYIVIVKHVYWTRFQNMSFFATSPPYKSPSPYSGPSPSFPGLRTASPLRLPHSLK